MNLTEDIVECDQCGSEVHDGNECACGSFLCVCCETYQKSEEMVKDANECNNCVISRAEARAEAHMDIY